MLQENVGKPWICRVKSFLRAAGLLLAGAVLIGWIIFAVSGVQPLGRSRVYAVGFSSEENAPGEVQAGLMGVINGVSDMERYSDAVRVASISDSEDAVLAGASGVDRRAIRKSAFLDAGSAAGQVGYLAEQTVVNNQMPASEYWTLVQIVEAETTGGDIYSKMMVAGVVLNRVKDAGFPDTIYDVVFEDSQFTPTDDGRFYSCSISEETLEAVERVLQGEDYSQGALYFMARASSDPYKAAWFDNSLTWLFSYGGHEFYTAAI